ncbi:Aspartic proteinase nepenthesin-1 [Dichanthelium oligosanthes]|uniref:Aspartic proteinase nepenthesin-1 n=1 Tax=Dichanthelium oligosanthes TaxID=888268 RepID=A0A1E5VUI2_9POAL|nr:Aspartic proteinase nepenthesin-1 [Dichanthelium oligosanthes]
MASKRWLLLCLLFPLPFFAVPSKPDRGIRLELTHVDARGGLLAAADRVRRAAERSHRRVNGLLAAVTAPSASSDGGGDGAATAAASVHASTATYLVDLTIGTPPLPLTAVLDTGSDLIWTQCDAPCQRCFPQPTPLYAPARSATYANVSCDSKLCEALPSPRSSRCSEPSCAYYFSYGDGSSTDGVLATDAFTFVSGATVHGLAFGCGTDNLGGTDNSSGLVGMGRGPLSLVSQLGVTRFSYCFTPFNDTTTSSPLFLGASASLSPAAQSTPFMPNPTGPRRGSYYYLSLEGITVGDTLLPIDPAVFQLTASGRGGLIIDSGTTFTALEERAFVVLARAVAARVALPLASGAHLGLSLCFAAPEGRGPEAVTVPRLVLHFDGADMELPRGSVVVEDRVAGVACLGMVSARGMSVLGSMQQQNMHILYDIGMGVLSFEPADNPMGSKWRQTSDDMACKCKPALLTLAAVLIGLIPPVTSATSPHGFRATLTRVHQYPGNYSAAARRDGRRLASFSDAASAGAHCTSTSSSRGLLQALVENGAGAYHMSLSVGTPPLAFPAILDTGSDLTWTQCAPCTACFAQPTPLYDPAASSTFSKVPCAGPLCQALPSAFRACNATGCVYDYRYTVGFTAGYLAADTIAIGDASFRGVAFGCSTANGGDMDNASGIVGLGSSALSLVSQLGVGRFSYCLRSDADAGASPILFGSLANVTGGKAQSTPLIQNPVARRAPYYYVHLTGITVGAAELPVTSGTFGFTAAGAGGVIVDSGTTFTYLAEAAYATVRQAFLSQTAGLTTVSGAPYDFDLCFAAGVAAADVPVPRLVLRFAGGAVYEVPRRSYFDAVDESGSVACLLLLPTRGVSVIGNVLQMDLHVLYDLDGGTFSFAPADCASI